MASRFVGLVAPGGMGAAVGGAVAASDAQVAWASSGRSAATCERARAHGFVDLGDLSSLVEESEILLSVCPPHAAVELARRVAELGFAGIYVDANAIAPSTARTIVTLLEPRARYVDGGITGVASGIAGGPTRLFLAGSESDRVAALFAGGPLETLVLEGGVPAASALKAAHSAWVKGSNALLLASLALAAADGVEKELIDQMGRTDPDFPGRGQAIVDLVSSRSWRFIAEMEEVATAFESANLSGGFAEAAGELYGRLAKHKDASAPPSLDDALADVLGGHLGRTSP